MINVFVIFYEYAMNVKNYDNCFSIIIVIITIINNRQTTSYIFLTVVLTFDMFFMDKIKYI